MLTRLARGAAVAGLTIAALAATIAPAFAAPGAFYAEMINRNSGKCANVAHGSDDNGAWIQQYHCDHTPAAKFLFIQNRDGYYEIQNQNSHRCIDTEYGWNHNGARTQQFNCNGSFTQQWQLVDLGNGYHNVVQRSGNRCVDVPFGTTDDWVPLQLWDCVAGSAQEQWRLNIG